MQKECYDVWIQKQKNCLQILRHLSGYFNKIRFCSKSAWVQKFIARVLKYLQPHARITFCSPDKKGSYLQRWSNPSSSCPQWALWKTIIIISKICFKSYDFSFCCTVAMIFPKMMTIVLSNGLKPFYSVGVQLLSYFVQEISNVLF